MAEEVTAEQEFDSAWEDTPVEEPETETSEEGWEEPAEETPEDELESGQDEDPEEGAKEEQRRKSWEGRLKKREEELKAKGIDCQVVGDAREVAQAIDAVHAGFAVGRDIG